MGCHCCGAGGSAVQPREAEPAEPAEPDVREQKTATCTEPAATAESAAKPAAERTEPKLRKSGESTGPLPREGAAVHVAVFRLSDQEIADIIQGCRVFASCV